MVSNKTPKMDLFLLCQRLNDFYNGLIIILIGREAEKFEPVFDKTRHDVRTVEPFLRPDDPVDWRIR